MANVFRVTRSESDIASEVLARAFLAESATQFFFPTQEGRREEKLRALFDWSIEYRMRNGAPVLGVRASLSESAGEGPLAGVATIRLPVMPDTPGEDELWEQASRAFGPEAVARLDRYDAAHHKHEWPAPHHYVVAIGVLPEFQGQGYGGKLLRAAIQLAEEDPESAGIGLDTGTDENQALYERFGFKLFARQQLDGHEARYLFRSKES